MNGFHPSTNFIGATGEYPIYDYIVNSSNTLSKNICSITQLIDGTSNTKIDSSGPAYRFIIRIYSIHLKMAG